jgi:hypothetical protein
MLSTDIIFLVAKYLIVALLLAYITSIFRKKKEVEVDVKAAKLEKQLEANVRIHKLLMETERHIAPAKKDELYYNSFLDGLYFKMDSTLHSYPKCFDSKENFENYYDKIRHEVQRDGPFLNYSMANHLSELMLWMEDIISLMETFSAVEAEPKWHFSQQVQYAHCSLAIKLLGVSLQNDAKKFMDSLREMFSNKLRHPSLSNWKDMTLSDKVNKYLSEKIEHNLDNNNSKQSLACWLYYDVLHHSYGRSQLVTRRSYMIILLARVHYSSKYNTEEFYSLKDDEADRIMTDFYNSFVKNSKQCQP